MHSSNHFETDHNFNVKMARILPYKQNKRYLKNYRSHCNLFVLKKIEQPAKFYHKLPFLAKLIWKQYFT